MSDLPVRCAIDANVVVRYLVGDDPPLAAKARAVLHSVENGTVEALCDPVTLAEIVWVLASFYKLPNSEIADGLLAILKTPGFVVADKDRYVLALELFAGSVRHFGDACACATALLGCDGMLCSFDRKLSSCPGITRRETMDQAGCGE